MRQAILLLIFGLFGPIHLQAETLEEALAKAAAGIDFTRTRTSKDLTDPGAAARANAAREIAAIARAERRAATSYWQYGKDILRTSAVGYLLHDINTGEAKHDPTFTTEQFLTRFGTARNELPPLVADAV